MKSTIKFFGILILVALFAFSMAACPDPDNNGNGNDNGGSTTPTPDPNSSPTSFGNTMTLSGRVYLEEWNESSVRYSNFSGNMTINCPYGGSGQVTNGNLSYTIGTPLNMEWLDFEDLLEGEMYYNLTSSRTVRGVIFDSLLTDSKNYQSLYRGLSTVNKQNNSVYYTDEEMIYIYVENDVTVTAKGITETDTYQYGTYTGITRDINLVFKAGWNTVHYKEEESETISGSSQNPTYNDTTTITISLNNPSNLRWSIHGYGIIDPDVQTDEKIQGAWFDDIGDYTLYINAGQMVVKYLTEVTTPYRTEFNYMTDGRYWAIGDTLPTGWLNGSTAPSIGDIVANMVLFDYATNEKIATLKIVRRLSGETLEITGIIWHIDENYYAMAFPNEGTYYSSLYFEYYE